MQETSALNAPASASATLLSVGFAALERRLYITTDAADIFEYLQSAYRRLVLAHPGIAPTGPHPLDHGFIAGLPQPEWLTFNGKHVEYTEDDVSTNFRRAFYGSSKLLRLSFQRNAAWHSLYGAAVSLGDRAVLIAAQSGIGKTTLALALLARGAKFFSDEFVFVRRADRMVSGLPRALMVRERTLGMFPDHRLRDLCERTKPRIPHGDRVWDTIDAGDVFGEDIFASPAPLRAAIVLQRTQDGTARLERIGPAQAAADFAKRFNSDISGFDRLAMVAELLADIPCYRLAARSPQSAAATIEAAL